MNTQFKYIAYLISNLSTIYTQDNHRLIHSLSTEKRPYPPPYLSLSVRYHTQIFDNFLKSRSLAILNTFSLSIESSVDQVSISWSVRPHPLQTESLSNWHWLTQGEWFTGFIGIFLYKKKQWRMNKHEVIGYRSSI